MRQKSSHSIDAAGVSCYCGERHEASNLRVRTLSGLPHRRTLGKQLGQTVLLVEYDATSPVNASETVVYGDADLLPSGMTGAEFKGIMLVVGNETKPKFLTPTYPCS